MTSKFDILRTKHWQWLLLFMALIIPVDSIRTFVGRFMSWIDVPLDSLVMAMYLAYPLLIRNGLNKLLAGEIRFKRAAGTLIVLATILYLMAPMIVPALPDGSVRFGLSMIFLCCNVFICALPARQLKSIELRRNAGPWEYASETFQFLMWPFGIFWLQPRINAVRHRHILISE